ncbi:MAG TPA: hypothetical protein VK645_11480 [Chitinophagaceae bacterium]|nr:hypothetical protein [Chitinophagaceae bacterium]
MSQLTQYLYTSSDGLKFTTEADLLKWEERKFHFTAIHLTNTQIVGLMEASFRFDFIDNPQSQNGEVILFVRADQETDFGFEFWFSVRIGAEIRNFKGGISGLEEMYISIGSNDDERYGLKDDWNNNFTIPIKRVYKYLDGIGYFDKQPEIPEANPIFEQDGWQQIYQVKY